MTFAILFALFWFVCGVLSYGATFAHFQRSFPELADKYRQEDRALALYSIWLGPVGLAAIASMAGLRHGFKWR